MTDPIPTVSVEEMEEKKEKKEKEEKKGGNMAKGASNFILPIGILVLGYYILKDWGIIGPTTDSPSLSLSLSWKPLTEQDVQNIRSILY